MTTASGNPRLDGKVKVLKALAHPARLLMAEELERGERCVCELQALVGLDISTVSKHLSLLKNAGVVADEKRGVKVFYRLTLPCFERFMGCVQEAMEQSVRKQMEALG
ncbi:MAG: winged helix-turn-helix transcriptional regulator [Victivallales bacterium]|jgi:DNA-binding transcriptional ArsR family regulator|nr:winged helix-turn-helix transcriptional regulator [Victivallales bacterium]MBT7299478.1 winged helix-turn-helix transcriptional regulator [Victivallales bacterium]